MFDATARRISQELLGQVLNEKVGMLEQRFAQSGRSIHNGTVVHFRGGVDRIADGVNAKTLVTDRVGVIPRAPPSSNVEIFQRQTNWVDQLMTRVTGRIRSMRFHAFANCQRLSI